MEGRVAAVVLAGGRSTRMGRSKPALPWHGSTLLERIVALLCRACEPVVVVHAATQKFPALPSAVVQTVDADEGRGPLEGIAAGLRAIAGSAEAAYVSAADVPLLHPAFVTAVTGALGEADVALPEVGGRVHPLAGCYRVALLPVVQARLDSGQLRLASLFDDLAVRRLGADDLLADERVARFDPRLDSLRNLNTPAEYEAALAEPEPAVRVTLHGAVGSHAVRAATIGRALDQLALGDQRARTLVALNGVRPGAGDSTPLVAGDELSLH